MATHFWLLPWISLAAALAALLLALMAQGASPFSSSPSSSPARPDPATVLLWLFVVIGGTLTSLRLGAAAGADVIGARGFLLGALGGAGMVLLCRRSAPNALPACVLSFGTALVTMGRLWLTHGEITGLTSLALGAALSVFCLEIAPSLRSLSPSKSLTDQSSHSLGIGLLYVLCLASAAILGFIRTHTLGDIYWADIPLLLGAGLSIGTAASIGRAGRSPLFPLMLSTIMAGLLVALPLSYLVHSWRIVEMFTLGTLLFGTLGLLSVRTGTEDNDRLGSLAGFLLIVAGSALSFALWSGYGLGLMALGGWIAVGPALLTRRVGMEVTAGLSFAAVLLVYRLALLQNTEAVRASGPGDTWDLFAIGLGMLLPLAVSEWSRIEGRQAGRLPDWVITLQWLLSLTVSALLLDYIWPPRSIAGVLLGTALGQLLAVTAGDERRSSVSIPAAVSGVIFSLALFEFLPALQEINPPTRYLRIAIILGGALLLALRLFITRRVPRRTAA